MDFDDEYEEVSNDSSGTEYFGDVEGSSEPSWEEMGFSIEGGDLAEDGDAMGDAFFAALDGSSGDNQKEDDEVLEAFLDAVGGEVAPKPDEKVYAIQDRKTAYISKQEENKAQEELDRVRAAQGNIDGMGGVTAQDFLLNKVSHMPYGVQAIMRDAAAGKSIPGLNKGYGVDQDSMQLAVGEFLKIANSDKAATDVTGASFANRIKLDPSVVPTYNDRDLRTAQSMFLNIEADMVQGPGSKLLGVDLTEERADKREAKELKAFETMERLVQMTKGGITGQPSEAAFESKVRDSIYASAMDSAAGQDSLAWVDFPSAYKFPGAVLTMSASGGPQGTGYNRHTFSENFGNLLNHNKNEDGTPATDEYGRLIPNNMALRKDLAKEMELNRLTGNRNSVELDTYFQNAPSLKATYMPKPADWGNRSYEDKQLWKAGRDKDWEEFEKDLIEARKTISGVTRTTTDESRGNQFRKSAFGRPQDDQANHANALDQAAIYGVEREDYLTPADDIQSTMGADRHKSLIAREIESLDGGYSSSGSPVPVFIGPPVPESISGERRQYNLDARSEMFTVGQTSGGSEQGGMFGSNDVTAQTQFLELSGIGTMDVEEILRFQDTGEMPEKEYADTEHGRYQRWVDTTKPPEQGTDKWFAQRSGNITASQADKLTGGKGTLTLAENMARERLGQKVEFRKNATMQRGNDLEDYARDEFLQFYADETGQGVNFEEAFFETNPNLPNLGVSPDGRLYTDEGDSAGLLEIKVLKHKNLDTAMRKYNKQMQMQMMVTGETQTHFYAMDADGSGDFVYETVQADPELQEELYRNAQLAINLSGRLNSIEDVEAQAMARIASKKSRKNKSSTGGQTTAYATTADMPKQAWRPAEEPNEEEYEARRQTLTGDRPGDSMVQKHDSISRIAKEFEREKWDKSDPAAAAEAGAATRNKEAKEASDAMAKLTNSVSEASESMMKFGSAAISAAAEIAGVATGANTSAMDTVRFAAKTGMSTEAARGMEFALQSGKGGMDLAGAKSNMSAAGKIQAEFNDVTKVGAAQTRLATAWAGAGLNETMGDLPEYSEIAEMNPNEILGMIADYQAKAKSPEERAQIDKVFETTMSVSKLDGDTLRNAKGHVDEDGNRSFYDGERSVKLGLQEGLETATGATGELGGKTAAVADVTGKLFSSDTAKSLTNLAASGVGGAGVGAAGIAVGKAGLATTARVAGTVAKGALRLAAPVGLAVMATEATRALTGVEDDGGVADSSMDVLEMAAWGAAVGSVVPGVGTAIGAAVGATAGLVTETWQHFNSDDTSSAVPAGDIRSSVVPSKSIADNGSLKPAASVVNENNITVNTTVDGDKVETKIDVNGEDYEDLTRKK